MDPKDIGTRFDPPATAADLSTGSDLATRTANVSLFSLLKGILLQLSAIADSPNDPTNDS